MNKKPVWSHTALCALLLVSASCGAAEAQDSSAAQAAALETKAAAMEADIDKECQKVAREARPLCREQRARAVQRLRDRAVRTR